MLLFEDVSLEIVKRIREIPSRVVQLANPFITRWIRINGEPEIGRRGTKTELQGF